MATAYHMEALRKQRVLERAVEARRRMQVVHSCLSSDVCCHNLPRISYTNYCAFMSEYLQESVTCLYVKIYNSRRIYRLHRGGRQNYNHHFYRLTILNYCYFIPMICRRQKQKLSQALTHTRRKKRKESTTTITNGALDQPQLKRSPPHQRRARPLTLPQLATT